MTFACIYVLQPKFVQSFHFSPFYLISFLMVISTGLNILCLFIYFFYKNRQQEGKTGPVGTGSSGREEDIRKCSKRMNMVETCCTCVSKLKNETC
jgi:hypothetical protein